MGRSSQSALPVNARQSLEKLVATRRGADVFEPELPTVSRFHAMTDFTTLPGYQEVKIQRSAAETLGIDNPFFRTHSVRAGATTVIDGATYDNFSSYDYLGLNGHPSVGIAAKGAIDDYGTSSSASRVVAGERPVHQELEAKLAAHYGQEACAVFVSGHATNVSTIGALMGPRDLILHDQLAHNSIIMGATMSRAERRSFAHNDIASLEQLLVSLRPQFKRVLIVVEGLYSMDGDVPDLAALIALKQRHGAWLMVDDAHGLGVLGQAGAGLFEHADIDPRSVDIWMGTLSKTLSSCGGYIAGCAALIEFLKCTSGGFVYSVGLPPAMAAAASAALDALHAEPERVARLRENGALFCQVAREHNLDIGSTTGLAVIPVIVYDSLVAVVLSQKMFERGVNVQPIIHPAVPERTSRLRFFITSEHTAEQIRRTVAIVAEELAAVGDSRAILKRLK
ncbi:aminotransferase class I/II-fold pyridoxal phosphate-dependent enzyme [Lichenihabitans sp. PAMC28606]|uniref:aminotransferase class I/II-fold pyridoxal phosphate-dependent enzyme n=1 Tax=Lichenihabitans sp. PAMC28606 TaxID=2880932 RepID=UPI0029CAB30A|nr:aminotransferase class I/II-fold pyridoxal phosphate-dependent enzyme [Lichenihabitans sp. PAMC28606]